MVKIRYLSKQGDTTQTVTLSEAQKVITEEMQKGNVVFDEDERRIVTNALGIKETSNIGILPRISGG
jgi:molybdopterin converting factor small subunit